MSGSDYPEHLNPFSEDEGKGKSFSLRRSFREFQRTLRQSFRKKKPKAIKYDVEVRHTRGETIPSRNQVMSCPPHNGAATLALPRSRFQERVSRAPVYDISNGTLPRRYSFDSTNPFEDEDKDYKMARKYKKRAPLPPVSSSAQDVTRDSLDAIHNLSKWSLTSAETDASIDDKDSNYSYEMSSSTPIKAELANLTKEIEKLATTDDSNNNIVTTDAAPDDENRQRSVPDVVVSCPSIEENCIVVAKSADDSGAANVDNKETEYSDKKTEVVQAEYCHESDELTKENGSDELTNKNGSDELTKENGSDELAKENGSQENATHDLTKPITNEISEKNKLENDDATIQVEESEKQELVKEEPSKKQQITKIESIDIGKYSVETQEEGASTEENNNTLVNTKMCSLAKAEDLSSSSASSSQNDIYKEQDYKDFNYSDIPNIDELEDTNYNERKSIYILGSKHSLDNLDNGNVYKADVSIYVESTVEKMSSSDASIENNNLDDAIPVPKQRKKKMGKLALLGQNGN